MTAAQESMRRINGHYVVPVAGPRFGCTNCGAVFLTCLQFTDVRCIWRKP